jgi:hypothetical protein
MEVYRSARRRARPERALLKWSPRRLLVILTFGIVTPGAWVASEPSPALATLIRGTPGACLRKEPQVKTSAHLSLLFDCAAKVVAKAELPVPSASAKEIHAKHADKYGKVVAERLPIIGMSWAVGG